MLKIIFIIYEEPRDSTRFRLLSPWSLQQVGTHLQTKF